MDRRIQIIAITVLLGVLFCLPSSAFSQEVTHHELKWEVIGLQVHGPDGAMLLLNFDGAVNDDSTGLLPLFYRKVQLESGMEQCHATLSQIVYEPLEVDPGLVPDAGMIGASPMVFSRVSTQRKVHYLYVYVLPFRSNPAGGSLERVLSFDLALEILPQGQDGREGRGSRTYAAHSVLATGQWFKLSTKEDGIYRINYDQLAEMGIDPGSIDPRNIRIYGNGSGMLKESNAVSRPDDLLENHIMVVGEEDGRFDPGDHVLFYGEGPVDWTFNSFFGKFEHEVNYYTDHTEYFLTTDLGPGLRIATDVPPAGEPTHEVVSYHAYAFHEMDDLNLIKSGKLWYGEVFSQETQHQFTFRFPKLDLTKPLTYKSNLVARSTETSAFKVHAEGQLILEEELAAVAPNTSVFARASTSNYLEFTAEDTIINILITYNRPNSTSTGWLNYIELNAECFLDFEQGKLRFRNTSVTGIGNIGRYSLSVPGIPARIWDVTSVQKVLDMTFTSADGSYSMLAAADSLREFIIFDDSHYLSPEFIGELPNQDLHALGSYDYIIVTHPLFLDEASRLADFHREFSALSTLVITPEKIYNEFSSGVQDISAIRDFMKMLYDRAEPGQEPRYLLLFGDASYDYLDRIPEDHNMVPAFQSRESLRYASSFVTDDFFGCMDSSEGNNGAGDPDIGVGRFPVQTLEQARLMVDKVIQYTTRSMAVSGNWRNNICFVADDQDNNTHLNQTEQLTGFVDTLSPWYNITKIYLDAYGQVRSPAGDRYPEVNQTIDKVVNSGTLLVNYTGHGGETGLAHERVLDVPMIMAWDNPDMLPAFMTATCEFSRYDDPGLVSAGELVLLKEGGGGIGLFTTSRLAYSQSNFTLNKRFCEAAFGIEDPDGAYPRMGDILRISKSPNNSNIKNFVLLGDPALALAYPALRVHTTNIVHETDGRLLDTLGSMSRVTVSGVITDRNGVTVEDFNGVVYPSVYDKPVLFTTRANDPDSREQNFLMQNKLLFKGESTVTGGAFEFSFVVPKDINYAFGNGKISYYALDTINLNDAQGFDHVVIGGTDVEAVADDMGPQIDLYLNYPGFKSGDITTPNPLMIVKLFDESGINTVGNGIGHELVAILDSAFTETIILNDYFVPQSDSYQYGSVYYRLGPLSNGWHTLTVRAWDIHNNSSEVTITFLVDTHAPIAFKELFNYPNPFREGTYFEFTHNQPGRDMQVVIRIFSLMGRLVRTIKEDLWFEKLEVDPIYWDGRDESGNLLPSGLYIYQVIVSSADNGVVSGARKLVISH